MTLVMLVNYGVTLAARDEPPIDRVGEARSDQQSNR